MIKLRHGNNKKKLELNNVAIPARPVVVACLAEGSTICWHGIKRL